MLNLQGFKHGGEESRTPVREPVHEDFFHRSRFWRFPVAAKTDKTAATGSPKIFCQARAGFTEFSA